MLERGKLDRGIVEIVDTESLVPRDHLLRKIDAAVDFNRLYEMVEPLYSEDNGRPSVDPVVLFKMVLIQHLYGLPSLWRTADEVSANICYRWFLGYTLQEEAPHFSTVSYNFRHRFTEEMVNQIFSWILEEVAEAGYLSPKAVFIDGTHIKANANTKKQIKEQVPVASRHYAKELMVEVNADREAHGKKTFDDDEDGPPTTPKKRKDNTSKKKLARRKKEKTHTVTKSMTDPDCGLFVKGDHKRQFAYEVHTACDKHGFVLETAVTPGNVHDSIAFDEVYKVTITQAEAAEVTSEDKKAILIDEHLADSGAMDYELDRQQGEWALADYVKKGIEVLNNNKGFFMMCEGGKIDWACHANDAGSTVSDTLALADAVQVAVDFTKQHPKDTLILVTGDHETGGLTIGYAGTGYNTYLSNLTSQTISYTQFDEQYVAKYKANKTSFEDAMKDVEKLLGLKLKGEAGDKLVLTDYEVQRLKTAYQLAMSDYDSGKYTQEQYVLYGTYNPFSVTVTHILNNKSGIDFTSYSHTGLPVAAFADGAGAESFGGYYDNTAIYTKLASMLKVK